MSEHDPNSPDDSFAPARELTLEDGIRDVRKVADDLQTIYSSASQRVNLGQIYQENPLAVLGVAAGVGYVLGGGLFTPLTARLLKLGARFVVIPVLTSQLERALPSEVNPNNPKETK